MPDYRRAWHPGGTYFFTVNLLQRHNNNILVEHIEILRNAVAAVRRRHPFHIHGWVVVPDHLHCVIDWHFSRFQRLMKNGVYAPDWGGGTESLLSYDD